MTRPLPKRLSFVVPLYNEEQTIPLLKLRLEALATVLDCEVEWILVNDGSRDETETLLFDWAEKDLRVKPLCFSRNFGHQAAVTAGLDHARGEAMLILDGDLQDPPELVLEMVQEYAKGADIVFGKRIIRRGESYFKRISASAFYWIWKKLSAPGMEINPGDFCLLSQSAADALCQLRERHRFLRGMVSWIGFPRSYVEFERPGRVAGQTKFPFLKMLRFAWDGLLSFSLLPLRLAISVGLIAFLFGIGYGSYSVVQHLRGNTVSGWTSLIVLQCLLTGAVLLALGIVGEYIGRIYEEMKQRPLYLIRRTANLNRLPKINLAHFPEQEHAR